MADAGGDGGGDATGGGDAGASGDAAGELRIGEVASALFADDATVRAALAACRSEESRVRCLLDERYRADPKAASLARELFERWRVVAGVEVAHTMDGGYRGRITIEPALPIGAERRHIEWIVLALRDFDAFFAALAQHGRAGRPAFRYTPSKLRFMRSVAARTPSAYASEWTVAWNLAGSLHTSSDAARETLFHEIFHLNDAVHPVHAPPAAGAWSFVALGPIYDAIVKRCGVRAGCLAPYTPNETMVRGGTYYAFQPGNDVREYAAELALRYYREQRAVLGSLRAPKPFKCGPHENAVAWMAMRDEFFGGVDLVPAC